jgi:hypothetical protein
MERAGVLSVCFNLGYYMMKITREDNNDLGFVLWLCLPRTRSA